MRNVPVVDAGSRVASLPRREGHVRQAPGLRSCERAPRGAREPNSAATHRHRVDTSQPFRTRDGDAPSRAIPRGPALPTPVPWDPRRRARGRRPRGARPCRTRLAGGRRGGRRLRGGRDPRRRLRAATRSGGPRRSAASLRSIGRGCRPRPGRTARGRDRRRPRPPSWRRRRAGRRLRPRAPLWDLVVGGVVALDALARGGEFDARGLLELPSEAAHGRASTPPRPGRETPQGAADPALGESAHRDPRSHRSPADRDGLPRPELQYAVPGVPAGWVPHVDMAWPEHRVAVEYPGFDQHRTDPDPVAAIDHGAAGR